MVAIELNCDTLIDETETSAAAQKAGCLGSNFAGRLSQKRPSGLHRNLKTYYIIYSSELQSSNLSVLQQEM